MDKFFDSIEAYIAAAKAKAVDVAAKGAQALRDLADYIEAQTKPSVGAAPIDAARLAACTAECQKLAAPLKGGTAVGAGPFAGILAKLIAALLAALK